MDNERPVNIYRQIAFTFAGFTLVLIVVVLYFTVSYAWITVVPKVEAINVGFTETIGKTDLNKGVVGRIVQTEISGKKVQVTQSKSSGVPGIATGNINVFNKTGKSMTFVKTTRFLTQEGVLFRAKNVVNLPANGETLIEVYADKKGETGDIGPSHFTVPGLGPGNEDIVFGESTENFTGGIEYDTAVSLDEIQKVKQALMDELSTKALTVLETQQKIGESFLKEASNVNVLSEKVSAKPGDKVGEFTVEMSVEVQALFSNELKIVDLAKKELAKKAGDDREVVSIDDGSLEFSLEQYDKVNQTALLKISLSGTSMLRRTNAILDKEILKGMKKQEILDYLKDKPGIEDVRVEFSPFWVRSVPRLKDHINIIIQEEL